MSKVVTKREVLYQLSTILRNRETLELDALTFLKVMKAYARLQGWLK